MFQLVDRVLTFSRKRQIWHDLLIAPGTKRGTTFADHLFYPAGSASATGKMEKAVCCRQSDADFAAAAGERPSKTIINPIAAKEFLNCRLRRV
ncbi:MAG TPA: hypothetical protein VKU82_02185 [Planctomycetaceae bacterium]|nr:hypothetical protein [Planctomycetaceae bacterium]